MIFGVVRAGQGRIHLKVKGPRGRVREVEAVIDTGYSAFLTLPPAWVAGLGLRWQSSDLITLADGSQRGVDVYEAQVVWDNRERRILVDGSDTEPLVGMGLLNGYELNMQVRHRGKVTIKRLSPKRR